MKKAAVCSYYVKNRSVRSKSFKQYHSLHKEDICLLRRARYVLAEPKPAVKEVYLKETQAHLLCDFEARSELIKVFKQVHKSVAERMPRILGKTVCRLAARRLVNKALQMRKEHAGCLIRSIRSIKCIQIAHREHFGKRSHSASTEPYLL